MPTLCRLVLLGSLTLVPATLYADAGSSRQVVRVFTTDPARIEALDRDADLWAVHPEKGMVIVGAEDTQVARWRNDGLQVEVDPRHSATLIAPRAFAEGTGGIPGFPCYRTVEETLATAQTLATDHPTLATVIDIGDSWEKQNNPANGYDLLVLRLTNSAIPGPKPKLYVNTAIHAREYTTAEFGTRFAESLIAGYGVDADTTWILDHHEVHSLLVANPDGRKRAETGLSWRKNTNNDHCSNTTDRGTDLNRNFTFEWGCCGGSSSNPCSMTYRGPAPASEPEDAAVVAYLPSIFPDQRPDDTTTPAPDDATGILLDVHSFGGDVLWSWGFTTTPPPNDAALYSLGRKYAYFTGYRPQHGSLSTVDGSTKDFAYGTLGVPGLTIELGTTFFESCASFESTILPDNLKALHQIAKLTRTPYQTPAGPDAVDTAATPLVAMPGTTVTIGAIVDDTRYGNTNGTEPSQPIAAAALYVDTPPWHPAATPMALLADDGTFNETVEAVSNTLDTSSLALGRHLLWIVGEDSDGNLGAPGAAFLFVLDPAISPTINGTVRDAQTGLPISATVTTGLFATTSDAGTGQYALLVPSDTYTLTASAGGYTGSTVEGIVAQDMQTVTQDFFLAPLQTIFFDDVEGGNQGWTAQSPWAIAAGTAHSPTQAWRDSAGNYGNNANTSLTSTTLDLSDLAGTTLRFWHRYDLEQGFDFGTVEVSTGGPWTAIASFSGDNGSTFEEVELDVAMLDGAATAQVRFRLDSDSSVTADGWYLDDIQIEAAATQVSPPLFGDGFESGDTSAWTVTVP